MNQSFVFNCPWFLRSVPGVGTLFFHLSRITTAMWVAVTVRVVRLVCGMKSWLCTVPYSSDFFQQKYLWDSSCNCGAFYVFFFFLSSVLLTFLSLRHTHRELRSVPYHQSFFKKRNVYQKQIPMDGQKNKTGIFSHFWFFPFNYLLVLHVLLPSTQFLFLF